ncbi:DUF3954 domain-containing protein [Virgibacillus dokdonensis]|nr:DUF3954 domain-containing protein [Virgibacillus dokdonensis]
MEKQNHETYIIRNGKEEKVTKPKSGYGKQTIVWQDGKISHYEVSFTEK